MLGYNIKKDVRSEEIYFKNKYSSSLFTDLAVILVTLGNYFYAK